MATAKQVMDKALSYVGVVEKPVNNVIFNTHYYGREVNGSEYPWCVVYVWDIFRMANASKLFYGGGKTASCGAYKRWAVANKKTVGLYDGKYGDVALFDWERDFDPDHMGVILEYVGNGVYKTLEGNTGADNSNGGKVMIRYRSVYNINCIIRPDYDENESLISDNIATMDKDKTTKSSLIAIGQREANKFVNANIVEDGVRGDKTKKAAIKVIQKALNMDYNAGLKIDGIWGSATDKAFGNHYVEVGERQYLVSALEILCYLKGKNPNGVEYPGYFGNGLKKACGKSKAVKSTFKKLCS